MTDRAESPTGAQVVTGSVPWARIAFIVGTVGLYSLVWFKPGLMAPWGIRLHEAGWFVDLHSLLNASDSRAAGADIIQWYPDWWYRLHDLGLHAADARWLGLASGAMFLLAAFLMLRPRRIGEAVYCWLVVCSPPVLLGFNRANVDLPLVAALALVGWLLSRERPLLRAFAPILIVFLAGLKFYPLAAGAALPFARRSRRESWLMIGGMAALTLLLVWLLREDLRRAARLVVIPYHYYIFGARQIFPVDPPARWTVVLPLCTAVAVILFWWRRTRPPPAGLEEPAVISFVLGASVLTGCFFAGLSYGYRLSVCVLMLPLLGALRRGRGQGLARTLSGLALAGLPILLWLDGVLCLLMNLRILPLTMAVAVAGRQLVYGLASWAWIGVVLGLVVMLARPVGQKLAGRTAP